MKRLLAAFFSSLLCLIFLAGCSSNDAEGDRVPTTDITAAQDNALFSSDATNVMMLLYESGMPIDISGSETYDEYTDRNELLGRPNQYTSKVNFNDSVYPVEYDVTSSIEVFNTPEDAETRHTYLQSVTKEYSYQRDNVLLRLDYAIPPNEAAEYEKLFYELDLNKTSSLSAADIANMKADAFIGLFPGMNIDSIIASLNSKEDVENYKFHRAEGDGYYKNGQGVMVTCQTSSDGSIMSISFSAPYNPEEEPEAPSSLGANFGRASGLRATQSERNNIVKQYEKLTPAMGNFLTAVLIQANEPQDSVGFILDGIEYRTSYEEGMLVQSILQSQQDFVPVEEYNPLFSSDSFQDDIELRLVENALSNIEKSSPSSPNESEPPNRGYYPGTYRVGEDIPPGLYYLDNDESYPGYYAIAKDSSGELDSLLDNDNFDTFTFVELKEGRYFSFERSTAYPADSIGPIQPDSDGYYEDGKYRVGIDIPAGEYKLESTNDNTGYWCRLEGANSVLGNIKANDNFNESTYVTVKEGEFFLVNRARFTK